MSSPTPYSSRPRGALGGNPSATSCCPEQPSLMWAAHPKPGIVWERFPTRTGAGGSPVFPVGRLALGHIQYGPGVSLAEESTKLQATAREQKLFSSFIKKKKKALSFSQPVPYVLFGLITRVTFRGLGNSSSLSSLSYFSYFLR